MSGDIFDVLTGTEGVEEGMLLASGGIKARDAAEHRRAHGAASPHRPPTVQRIIHILKCQHCQD